MKPQTFLRAVDGRRREMDRWLKRSEGLLKARFGQPEPSMNPGPDVARTRLTGACSAEGFKRLPRGSELSITVNRNTGAVVLLVRVAGDP